MTALHHDYSTLDRYDGLGEPLQPPTTYPAGWFVIAGITAVIALWWGFMILAVVGAVVLGVLNIIRAIAERRSHEAGTP